MARVRKTMRKRSNTKRSNTKRSNTKRSKTMRSKTMRSKTQRGGGVDSLRKEINILTDSKDANLTSLILANDEYFNQNNDKFIKENKEKLKAVMFKNNKLFDKKTHPLDIEKKLNEIRYFLTNSVIFNLNMIFMLYKIGCSPEYKFITKMDDKINKEHIKCMLTFLQGEGFTKLNPQEKAKWEKMLIKTLYYLIGLIALEELYNENGLEKRAMIWYNYDEEISIISTPPGENESGYGSDTMSIGSDTSAGGRRKKRSKSKTRRHR
jgi:hypothetical protein